jgi:hypothetical protein
VILAMTRMISLPWVRLRRSAFPPAPGPLECCPLADIDLEDFARRRYLGREFTLGHTVWTDPWCSTPSQKSRSLAFSSLLVPVHDDGSG